MSRRPPAVRRGLAAAAATALVVGAAWFEPLARAWPVLGVWRGPLGVAAVIAALLAGAGLPGIVARRAAACSAFTLFVVAGGVFLSAGLPYTARLQASGDEVEYLLLAQSLWREHDLDVQDNFARGEHLEYVPGLDAAPFGTYRADGRPISTHSPGLPLLLAPFYALGGRTACVVFLALIGAWLTVEIRRLAWALTGDAPAAGLAWLAALGPPVFFYSFHVYTEAPSALAGAWALRLLLGSAGPWGAAAAALALAALPWLHVKMIPAAGLVGLLGLVRLRGRARVVFVVLGLAAAAGYLHHYWRVFGTPSPLGLYGGRLPKKVRRATPGAAVPGLLMDSSFGLLPNAPVYLLAGAGMLVALRRRGLPRATPLASAAGGPDRCAPAAPREVLGALTVYGLATLAPLVAWQTWWAGHCPPARFLVPAVPWLATLVALRVAWSPQRGLARAAPALSLAGLALAAVMTAEPRELRLLNSPAEPTRIWQALAGRAVAGVDPATATLGRYLPRLVGGERRDVHLALAWGLGLGLLLVWDLRRGRAGAPQREFGDGVP